jgi:hypothetical protein
MDKRKITSLIVCIALLGFTVVPASYIPCCCSGGHAAVEKKPASCCKAETERDATKCCREGKGETACTVAKILRTPLKGDCRCLEQITTVTLPTFNAHLTKKTRGPGTALASVVAVPVPSTAFREACPEGGTSRPGLLIRLKTCTFLC